MGVVDLDDVLLVEVPQGAVLGLVLPADVLHGGGDEEILLLEPQGLALVVVVLGVEDLGDGLGHGLLLHGLQVLAPGEEGHVQGDGALGVPQPEDVDVVGAVAGDLHVLGHGQHVAAPLVDHGVAAVGVPHVLHGAAEADLLYLVHLGDEPGVAQAQPVVGQLHLLAVHDLLLEEAQLVADGVAGGGDLQGGHGVQVAGGQTAQAAVAQTGVGLHLEEVGGGEAQVLDGLLQLWQDPQVVGVLLQGPAHEELQGQVVDLAGVAVPDPALGGQLPGGHDVPQHQGAGAEHVDRGSLFHFTAKIPAQLADDLLLQLFLRVFRRHWRTSPFQRRIAEETGTAGASPRRVGAGPLWGYG